MNRITICAEIGEKHTHIYTGANKDGGTYFDSLLVVSDLDDIEAALVEEAHRICHVIRKCERERGAGNLSAVSRAFKALKEEKTDGYTEA